MSRTGGWSLVCALGGVLVASSSSATPYTRADAVAAAAAPAVAPPPEVAAPDQPPNLLAMASNAAELDRAASILDAEERQLKEQQAVAQRELGQLGQRVITSGRAYVRLTRAGLLPLGGGFEAFLQRATRIERLKRSVELDLQRQTALHRRVVEIGQRLQNLQGQRAPLVAGQLASLRARTTLADAQDRASAFERAFSPAQSAHTAVYGARVDVADENQGFSAMKGRLAFPVTGRAEILRAKRRGGGGPGLELRVYPGAPVQAVFPGRVAFSERYADYGRTVIIDHGQGYFTVTGGLDQVQVSVGQRVIAGATLGTAGAAEGGAGVYFEVRLAGEPVDPAPWFGL